MAQLSGPDQRAPLDKVLQISGRRSTRRSGDADIILRAQAALEAVDAFAENPRDGFLLTRVGNATGLNPKLGGGLSLGDYGDSTVTVIKFAIGDKVDQAFSNHAEGTVVAIFTDRAGMHRYAVEMFGHRTIQVANEGSLIAHCNSAA